MVLQYLCSVQTTSVATFAVDAVAQACRIPAIAGKHTIATVPAHLIHASCLVPGDCHAHFLYEPFLWQTLVFTERSAPGCDCELLLELFCAFQASWLSSLREAWSSLMVHTLVVLRKNYHGLRWGNRCQRGFSMALGVRSSYWTRNGSVQQTFSIIQSGWLVLTSKAVKASSSQEEKWLSFTAALW